MFIPSLEEMLVSGHDFKPLRILLSCSAETFSAASLAPEVFLSAG
jgi:hypothetical protein